MLVGNNISTYMRERENIQRVTHVLVDVLQSEIKFSIFVRDIIFLSFFSFFFGKNMRNIILQSISVVIMLSEVTFAPKQF